jgi:hypothetical protein
MMGEGKGRKGAEEWGKVNTSKFRGRLEGGRKKEG